MSLSWWLCCACVVVVSLVGLAAVSLSFFVVLSRVALLSLSLSIVGPSALAIGCGRAGVGLSVCRSVGCLSTGCRIGSSCRSVGGLSIGCGIGSSCLLPGCGIGLASLSIGCPSLGLSLQEQLFRSLERLVSCRSLNQLCGRLLCEERSRCFECPQSSLRGVFEPSSLLCCRLSGLSVFVCCIWLGGNRIQAQPSSSMRTDAPALCSPLGFAMDQKL